MTKVHADTLSEIRLFMHRREVSPAPILLPYSKVIVWKEQAVQTCDALDRSRLRVLLHPLGADECKGTPIWVVDKKVREV